tara:strand:+ start:1008 stop:1271 length:264 start_codon:yes stop_codon:yes gene_type:complete
MQQGEGIRVSGTAVPGGNISVNVGTADSIVEIRIQGSQARTSHEVAGNKNASIPVPPGAGPGTQIIVTVGKGLRRRRFVITVTAPGP